MFQQIKPGYAGSSNSAGSGAISRVESLQFLVPRKKGFQASIDPDSPAWAGNLRDCCRALKY
jgi:hypothetical protein